jgi:5-methyltetrahydropteroyltriglutamate--homocysteine methyltransferase
MPLAVNLGFPRIGPQRELKRVIESHWRGAAGEQDVAQVAASLRRDSWQRQAAAGIEQIPSNDFSLYDQMLDMTCLLGAVPERFEHDAETVDLDTYFAMARGADDHRGSVHPLEMTKWFDTNYHYLVPELGPRTTFRVAARKPFDELVEARSLGIETRPVLIGPITYLSLSKATVDGFAPLDLLPRLVPVYGEILRELATAGATWIQLDEPALAGDLDPAALAAFSEVYRALAHSLEGAAKLLLATYFGGIGPHLDLVASLPVDGVHVDLVRDPHQALEIATRLRPDTVLSAGVVDGRNVWRTDLERALDLLDPLRDVVGTERLWVAPSCSLLHVPYDVEHETSIHPEVRSWLAFAQQKLREVSSLARGVAHGRAAIGDELAASDDVVERRAAASRPTDPARRGVPDRRTSAYDQRQRAQRAALGLPLLATTTIGSFPQTVEIRRARREHAAGRLDDVHYRHFCEAEIERVIRAQEDIGLDVLVHGEPERNDMVQYFGERLAGFAVSDNGWVQSYGTRCVRPPILYGDVERVEPITVEWARYAQSLTSRPVKGMLTGPVTILQWSFVRDDRPRDVTCRQIALALHHEVVDLERAGIDIIQVDEPALREGLPLRRADWDDYLSWATACFRLATSGVADRTQIHTHMCYAEFGDIIDAVNALDADVISLESARSGLAVLDRLADEQVVAGVGPGVYDIHAPQIPTVREVRDAIERARRVLPPERLWVNPDCGLKTREWAEVDVALRNMVEAARNARGAVGT